MRTHIVKNRFVLPVLALAMLLAACDNSDCAPQWRISDGPHMGMTGGVLFDLPGSPTCDLAGFGGQP